MTQANWNLLGQAVDAAIKHPETDPLKGFREQAYATAFPWGRNEAVRSRWNVAALFRSMADHLDQPGELDRLLVLMDEARSQGRMPSATGEAGDILIERARGTAGYRSLPEGWEDRALVAYGRGRNSSGAYWAGAMLRAAGHQVPALGIEEDEGTAGPSASPGEGPTPPAPDGGLDL